MKIAVGIISRQLHKYIILLILLVMFAILAWFSWPDKGRRTSYPSPTEPLQSDQENATSSDVLTVDTATSSTHASTTEPVKIPSTKIIENVPFTAQAPFGDWDDVRQDYGCEEACLLMAMHWKSGEPLTPDYARDQIVAISEFELDTFKHHHDYSIADTQKVLEGYFGHKNSTVRYDAEIDDIKAEIINDNLVVIPIDGRQVTNPHYSSPGPFHHQILVIGYDDESQELIVHDPGTRQGSAFRYSYKEIEVAWRDYDTGLNEPVKNISRAMLVIEK